MSKESVVPNQGIRERHLNIVYFIDSSKSHSVRINLTLARWILAGSVGLILWSLLSVGWIISLGHILSSTRSQLSEALTSIFDYQVKYDKVFDVAYPDNATQAYYSQGSHLPSNNPTEQNTNSAAEKPPAAVAPTAVVASTTAPANTVAKEASTSPATVAAVKAPEVAPPSGALALDIRSPTLTATSGRLTLTFDIFNKDIRTKADGYIWATASIKLADGSIKKVVAPAHSKVGSDGNVESYISTYKFGIQKFKRKDFTFSAPQGDTWTVSDVVITYADVHGKQRQSFPVTAALQRGKAAPSASATETDKAADAVDDKTTEEPTP